MADALQTRYPRGCGEIDLVLLDDRLPGDDGFSLMREIRQHSLLPVIFVRGWDSDVERILGLERGADDLVVNPFNAVDVRPAAPKGGR
ncbi:MAG: response regulator [Gammaproteobacteria bacterium]|nr:response regulator [Gammaproteobacteria bacterium]